MSRLFALALLFVVLAESLQAEEGFRPLFEFGTSFVMGNATELVLRDGTYSNPLSRLVWPVPPSLAIDFAVVWPWTSWTSTTVAMGATFPLAPGTMIDEDWNTGSGPNDYSYAKSQQQAYLTSHWTVRVEQDLYRSPSELHIGFGMIYRWTSWEGWNGTGHYEQNNGVVVDNTFSGLVIAYRQQWLIPYISGSWTWENPGWKMTPSVRLSPILFCYDMDNHNYASEATFTFLDNTQGGVYGESDVEMEFLGGSHWNWGIRAGWEIAWGSIGSTTKTYSVQSPSGATTAFAPQPDQAGTWFQEASLTIFVRN